DKALSCYHWAGLETMNTISHRAMSLASVIVAPLVVLAAMVSHGGVVALVALAWAAVSLGIVWLVSSSFVRRVRELTAFAENLPELRRPRPQLTPDNDELGDLARALSRTTPRLEEVLNGLSTELGRREAILASMTEGVLAVDAKLRVSFHNEFFT